MDSGRRKDDVDFGIHLLRKTSRKNLGISWTLRAAVMTALITTASVLLKGGLQNASRNENNADNILSFEKILFQNQTSLLANYNKTNFVKGETCIEGLPAIFSTIGNATASETPYRVTGITLPHLGLKLNSSDCTIKLNNLCNGRQWHFFVRNRNYRFRYLHTAFNQTCCPLLNGMCSNLAIIPPRLQLSASTTESTDSGLLAGGSLALFFILTEIMNTYLTEARKTLSSPRLFFFPLYKQFSLFSTNDEKIIRGFASKYNITILENDLNGTLNNFKESKEPKEANNNLRL